MFFSSKTQVGKRTEKEENSLKYNIFGAKLTSPRLTSDEVPMYFVFAS